MVKLRDPDRRTEAVIFVAPGITAAISGLPTGPWYADLAVGEMWSRACGSFAAGMRAQRLPMPIGSGAVLTIPPDSPPDDIPDQTFVRDQGGEVSGGSRP